MCAPSSCKTKSLMVDARSMRFETLSYAWDQNNSLSDETPTIMDLSIRF